MPLWPGVRREPSELPAKAGPRRTSLRTRRCSRSASSLTPAPKSSKSSARDVQGNDPLRAPHEGAEDARKVVRSGRRRSGGQAPSRLIEDVVAHDRPRLRADHGRDFWAALGRAMPDYERRRDALRMTGPTFEW